MSLATPMPTIQKGAIGVVFIFTVCDGAGKVVNISTADLLEAYFFKVRAASGLSSGPELAGAQ